MTGGDKVLKTYVKIRCFFMGFYKVNWKPNFLPLLTRYIFEATNSTLVTSVSKNSSADQSKLAKQVVPDCKMDYMAYRNSWTLDASVYSELWTLPLTVVERNQSPVSDFV